MKYLFRVLFLIWLCVAMACSSENKSPAPMVTSDETTATVQTEQKAPVILFFGNSLTAGYGLDPTEAFPHLIQLRLDSLGWDYQVINAGLSGETSKTGSNRIDWVLREPVEYMILELGGNDGLRGIATDEMERNLQSIIDQSREKYPDMVIILAGMEAPPNMGADYVSDFRAVYPRLAEENNLPLIPFLLQDVGGEEELNLPDGIHPNIEGHRIVAENVWKILETVLEANSVGVGDN